MIAVGLLVKLVLLYTTRVHIPFGTEYREDHTFEVVAYPGTPLLTRSAANVPVNGLLPVLMAAEPEELIVVLVNAADPCGPSRLIRLMMLPLGATRLNI